MRLKSMLLGWSYNYYNRDVGERDEIPTPDRNARYGSVLKSRLHPDNCVSFSIPNQDR
jgi:hypothetical protein